MLLRNTQSLLAALAVLDSPSFGGLVPAWVAKLRFLHLRLSLLSCCLVRWIFLCVLHARLLGGHWFLWVRAKNLVCRGQTRRTCKTNARQGAKDWELLRTWSGLLPLLLQASFSKPRPLWVWASPSLSLSLSLSTCLLSLSACLLPCFLELVVSPLLPAKHCEKWLLLFVKLLYNDGIWTSNKCDWPRPPTRKGPRLSWKLASWGRGTVWQCCLKRFCLMWEKATQVDMWAGHSWKV